MLLPSRDLVKLLEAARWPLTSVKIEAQGSEVLLPLASIHVGSWHTKMWGNLHFSSREVSICADVFAGVVAWKASPD